MPMPATDWSLGSNSSVSSSSTLTLATTNVRLRRPLQQAQWAAHCSSKLRTDPVLLIALLELESIEDASKAGCSNSSRASCQRFVTKLRIRASEVRTLKPDGGSSVSRDGTRSVCSADSLGSQNYKDWIYTAQDLRNKIRLYFAAVPSAASLPSWGYDVFVCSAALAHNEEYFVPLPSDDRYNVVEQFGSRWRIRLRERRQPDRVFKAASEVLPNSLGGVFTVAFETKKTRRSDDVQGSERFRGVHRNPHAPSKDADACMSAKESSLYLARHVEQNPGVVQGKQVLVFAANGCPLPGHTAAMLGANQVTMAIASNNRSPQVEAEMIGCIHHVRGTAEVQASQAVSQDFNEVMTYRHFDWQSPADFISKLGREQLDVVLLDDCINVDRDLLFFTLRSLLDVSPAKSKKSTKRKKKCVSFEGVLDQSMRHLDVDKGPQLPSPVNSWSDIYVTDCRISDQQGCKILFTTDEASYCTLYEPPPDEDVSSYGLSVSDGSVRDYIHGSCTMPDCFGSIDFDDTFSPQPKSPDCVARVIVRPSFKAPFPMSTVHSRYKRTTLLFSYSCQDGETHETFRTALIDLFPVVEDVRMNGAPEDYHLLMCELLEEHG
jgi:hypothetical protein